MSKALLQRRSLLKALGASAFLATPVFRAALSEAQAAAPMRFIMIQYPGGIPAVDNSLSPSTWPHWNYGSILSGLAPYQSDILGFDRLHNGAELKQKARTPVASNGHGGGTKTILSGDSRGGGYGDGNPAVPEFGPAGPGGVTTLDQIMSRAIGSRTQIGALNLGIMTDAGGDEPWNRRSIIADGLPIAPDQDPMTVFARLFGSGAPPAQPTSNDPAAGLALQRLYNRGKSRLDQLKSEVTEIKGLTASFEQQKLDQHLTALRELEMKLPALGTGTGVIPTPGVSCGAPTLGTGTDLPAIAAAQNELMFQAINCDITRIATMQWLSTTNDSTDFPFINVRQGSHGMQHGYRDGEPDLTNFITVQTWFLSQIGTFLKRMKETPEGSGSVLDNSMVYIITELTDGTAHSCDPMLALVAGKGGGVFRPGRFMDVAEKSSNDLLLTFAHTMGVPLTTVGDADLCTGPLNVG